MIYKIIDLICNLLGALEMGIKYLIVYNILDWFGYFDIPEESNFNFPESKELDTEKKPKKRVIGFDSPDIPVMEGCYMLLFLVLPVAIKLVYSFFL